MPICDFRPSDVFLGQMFVGTFDHSEAENTAAVIVRVLAMNGDVWRSAHCHELADGFAELTKAANSLDPTSKEGPWRKWFNNPFMRIDMHDLVDRGFAEWDGEKAIRFTDKGLKRMKKWVAASQAQKGQK